MENAFIGKGLILLGVIVLCAGIMFVFMPKIPYLGKLPGDIAFQSGNLRIYFPIVTCIILSLLLSLILNLFVSKSH
jgi:hypothetical protein